MKKAFSLSEMLVTLTVVGIIVAVVLNVYNGIQNSATAVAQQKNQAELNQVLSELHMSGGNLLAILNAGAPSYIKALALTQLLQGRLNSASETQKGTVGNPLPATEVIVPYGYADYTNYGSPPNAAYNGKPRIVFSVSGVPAVVTPATPEEAAPGFIAVNGGSNEGGQFNQLASRAMVINQAQVLSGTGAGATSGAAFSNLTGSKYASKNSYLWDEDTSIIPGPASAPASAPAPVSLPGITFAIAYGNLTAPDHAAPGAFTFADYTSATYGKVYVFAYRNNLTDLQSGDIALTATFGGNSGGSTALTMAASLGSDGFDGSVTGLKNPSGGSLSGLLLTVPLEATLDAGAWGGNTTEALTVIATVTNPADINNNYGQPYVAPPAVVTAAAVALNPPVTPGNDTLAPGQSFTLTPDPTQENVASISVSGDYSADNLSGAQSGSDYIFTDTNTADSNNNPGN